MKLRNWVPNQHGAWAMLITPLAIVGFVNGWNLPLLLLIPAWLTGYMASFYLGQTLKSRRNRKRYLPQIMVYGFISSAFVIPSLFLKPELLFFAPIAAIGLAINLYFIQRRNERHWLNDFAGITTSFALGLNALNWLEVVEIEVLFWPYLYFIGTVFYVKTMIRESGNRNWKLASWGFHSGILLLAIFNAPLVAIGYLVATVRAFALVNVKLKVALVGIIEIWLTALITLLTLMCP